MLRKKRKGLVDSHGKELVFRDEKDWKQRPLLQDNRRDVKRTKGRTDDHLPRSMLFFKDYIKSDWYKKRYESYFEHHPRACRVCRSSEHLKLFFAKFAYYGYEEDRDLIPLCTIHYNELQRRVPTRTNRRYQAQHVVEEMAKEWAREREVIPVMSVAGSAPAHTKTVEQPFIVVMVDKLARPIWLLIDIVLRR